MVMFIISSNESLEKTTSQMLQINKRRPLSILIALCSLNNGNCDHECDDTDAGPQCKCPAGYTLGDNKRSCIGEHNLLCILYRSM